MSEEKMKGLPFITIEEIERNRFLLRFVDGEGYILTWKPTSNSELSEKHVTIKEMAVTCRNAIIKFTRLFAIEWKDPKNGKWKDPLTGKKRKIH